jgi:oxygen-independent coproporphyrinogen-3 oxidase
MCEGSVDMREVDDRYGIAFERYFASALTALRSMAEDGLVEMAAGRIVVYPPGPPSAAQHRNVLRCRISIGKRRR